MANSSVIYPFAGGSFTVQSGTQVVAASTTTLVTLPVNFTGVGTYAVFATPSDALVSAANDYEIQVVTNGTFNIRNNDAGAAHTFNWVAIGI